MVTIHTGTDVKGIFETAGSPKRLQELQQGFDHPPRYGKGLDWTGYTVHDAASIMLRYLLQLPEPVVPLSFHEKFLEPLSIVSTESKISIDYSLELVQLLQRLEIDEDTVANRYVQLLTELPPLHRQLLLYILDTLAVFASKSEINEMTTVKLAAIFQPAILDHPDHRNVLESKLKSQCVLEFLIENQDNFLIGFQPPAEAKAVQS